MSFTQSGNSAQANISTFNGVRGDQSNTWNIHATAINLDALLNPVKDAAYNGGGARVSKCLPGTRLSVFSWIESWLRDDLNRPICWLSGSAGSGKSAITRSLAEILAAQGLLTASFFFFRGTGGRSSINRFIPTLARLLSISTPKTVPYFEELVRRDPFVVSQDLENQFHKLILEPFLSLPERPTPNIIVIDALDECDDKAAMAEFIHIVTIAATTMPNFPFKIIFTGRMEEHLQRRFETDASRAVTRFLSLHHFSANNDIRTFYQASFASVYQQHCRRRMRGVPEPWPSESDLNSLVDLTQGLFIFAQTVVNFVPDGNGLPHEKLEKALKGQTGLDNMYSMILESVDQSDLFQEVLGTIMVLKRPLSIQALGLLLQKDELHMLDALLGIQSILIIPENEADPVQVIRTSLRDYLTSPQRSLQFYVDPPRRHFHMSRQSLMTLSISSSQKFFEPEAERYASEYWCHHLKNFLDQWDLFQDPEACRLLMLILSEFASTNFNVWVNTVLDTADAYHVPYHLTSLVDMVNGRNNMPTMLPRILEDIRRYFEVNVVGM